MTTLADLEGTTWTGDAELWLDPLGDEAERSACTIRVEADAVRYEWARGDEPQQGSLELTKDAAVFTDTFHSTEPMTMDVVDGRAMLTLAGTYGAGDGPDWGWRIALVFRPLGDGQLVLQMTNIAPWGEESRAVRMVCTHADG